MELSVESAAYEAIRTFRSLDKTHECMFWRFDICKKMLEAQQLEEKYARLPKGHRCEEGEIYHTWLRLIKLLHERLDKDIAKLAKAHQAATEKQLKAFWREKGVLEILRLRDAEIKAIEHVEKARLELSAEQIARLVEEESKDYESFKLLPTDPRSEKGVIYNAQVMALYQIGRDLEDAIRDLFPPLEL